MKLGEPSQTALRAAALRAAHQVLDAGYIFTDPLAVRILGAQASALIRDVGDHPNRREWRPVVAARSRFAEDAVAQAVTRGASQLVILGAGLDTYAYRSLFGEKLRMFEVDHPATQSWKRRRLNDAEIIVPPALTFAPVDFENQTLTDGLRNAGFDFTQQTFFTWLGVVPYLPERAIFVTLDFIAGLPGGARIVFDYVKPPSSVSDAEGRGALEALAARVAAVGEVFQSYFETERLGTRLRELGFHELEDYSAPRLVALYSPDRTAASSTASWHILRAATGH